jgi:hypothetical protein
MCVTEITPIITHELRDVMGIVIISFIRISHVLSFHVYMYTAVKFSGYRRFLSMIPNDDRRGRDEGVQYRVEHRAYM